MKNARSGHGISYLNDSIFVVGGHSDVNNYLKSCERYDIESNSWQEIANLNYKVNNCCVCAFKNNYLFKFGGKLNDKEINNIIEKYNMT